MRVSLIIPTYNRAHLIERTLDSVLAQTRVPDEIVVVDDGSSDDTLARLAAYPPPVRVLALPHNQGRSAARNAGLAAATGDLIAFLDSDDTLPPESIALRAAYLEAHPEVGAVYGLTQHIAADGTSAGEHRPKDLRGYPTGDLFPHLARFNFLPIHAPMFRRACWQAKAFFPLDLHILEDWWFWLQLAETCVWGFIPVPVARYQHHASMTMTAESQTAMLQNAVLLYSRLQALPAWASLTRTAQARSYAWLALRHAALGQGAPMWQALGAAFRRAPWDARLLLFVARAVRLLALQAQAHP